jgi:hypothetical protein
LIEAVEPVLLKYNLILMQPIENGCVVTRICRLRRVVKAVESSLMRLPEISKIPQKCRKCRDLLYRQVYACKALLSLASGRYDDAQDVQRTTIKKQKPKFPQDRFENGLTKVSNGELTADAFKKALEGFELTELQTAAIKLI